MLDARLDPQVHRPLGGDDVTSVVEGGSDASGDGEADGLVGEEKRP
jgi:hypothetical protein